MARGWRSCPIARVAVGAEGDAPSPSLAVTLQEQRKMLEKELEIMIAATKGCRSVCVLYGTIERRAPPTRALLTPTPPAEPRA